MNSVRLAVVGVGNCASALIQGIYYYASKDSVSSTGLMHHEIGGIRPQDIEVVCAFDIDSRKVNRDISEAIFAKPNCTKQFCPVPRSLNVPVSMGTVLDGVSPHLANYPEDQRIVLADQSEPTMNEVVDLLRHAQTQVVANYLPVGSEAATEFYAECALRAGCAFVNNIPVFIASDPTWARKFSDHQLPLLGDDIKSQLGATITHRTLVDLLRKRGVVLDRTYQLNTGGNTDFLNMLNRDRLASKKTSKTEAVQAVAGRRIMDRNIHVGPSDYVPWQDDNKIAFIRIEGRLFGDVPMELELRLSVEDSPNSAGVAIDAIRCAKFALDRGASGPIDAPSAYFYKHPPVQMDDDEAYRRVEAYLRQPLGQTKHVNVRTKATADR